MPAEILVSAMQSKRRPTYIVCIRDTAERSKAEDALKDSEARYRVLVENAPEAVVVLDVESGRFVDCNDNAAEFFKMSREDLLRVGPEQVSPAEQADGTPSFGVARGHIEARTGRRDAGLRMAAQGCRRQADPERSALRAPAELRAAT